MKSDFYFVKELLGDFFNLKHIIEMFLLFEKEGISGWENWLQIELVCFLANHDNVADVKKEQKKYIDRRSNLGKDYVFIDVVFRKKFTRKDLRIGLEIKQSSVNSDCVIKMLRDVHKVNSIKSSDRNFSSLWNVGIHPTSCKERLKELVESKLLISDNCFHTQHIKKTGLSFTLF